MHDDPSTIQPGLQRLVDSTLKRIRAAGCDLQTVEVKQASGGLPRSVLESVCAFANTGGGLLLLGLTDGDFRPVDIDAPRLAGDLASACADGLVPAVRPEIDVATVEGRAVVAARVEELGHERRPCHVRSRGLERGTYLRTHDGDRRLNSYEVHVMVSGRGQPDDDAAVVPGTRPADLDAQLVDALLHRLRETRGPVFGQAGGEEVLHMLGVLAEPAADSPVTLAGLLALGRYPQQFLPQLAASFVALPTPGGEPMADGTRFLDNQPLDGPIPMIVSGALDAMRRNMRRRSVVVGAGRQDVWDYPIEAIREIVANALMHRDYHPSAHGSQVRIALYPDRFEVASAGGLHGPNAGRTNVDQLIGRGITATRNARLAKLLEDVVIPGSGRPVCENRGSGLRATVAALRRAGMSPPILTDDVGELRVTIGRHSPDESTLPAQGGPNSTGHGFPRITDVTVGAPAAQGRPETRPAAGRGGGAWTEREARRETGTDPARSGISAAAAPELAPRERQIVELLASGSRSSSEIARSIGISQQAVLRWLTRMADSGLVRATEPERRNRRNRWVLTR